MPELKSQRTKLCCSLHSSNKSLRNFYLFLLYLFFWKYFNYLNYHLLHRMYKIFFFFVVSINICSHESHCHYFAGWKWNIFIAKCIPAWPSRIFKGIFDYTIWHNFRISDSIGWVWRKVFATASRLRTRTETPSFILKVILKWYSTLHCFLKPLVSELYCKATIIKR